MDSKRQWEESGSPADPSEEEKNGLKRIFDTVRETADKARSGAANALEDQEQRGESLAGIRFEPAQPGELKLLAVRAGGITLLLLASLLTKEFPWWRSLICAVLCGAAWLPTLLLVWKRGLQGDWLHRYTAILAAGIGMVCLGRPGAAGVCVFLEEVSEKVLGLAEYFLARAWIRYSVPFPDTALRVIDGSECTVPRAELMPGMTISVRNGDVLPTDAAAPGPAQAELRPLTGEGERRTFRRGEILPGGAVFCSETMELTVTCAASECAGERKNRLLEAKTRACRLDRARKPAEKRYSAVAVCVALTAGIAVPLFITGDWRVWLGRAFALTLLVSPDVFRRVAICTRCCGTALLARRGILFGAGARPEDAAAVKTAVVGPELCAAGRGSLQMPDEGIRLAAAAVGACPGYAADAARVSGGRICTQWAQRLQIPGEGYVCRLGDGTDLLFGRRSLLEKMGLTAGTAEGEFFVSRGRETLAGGTISCERAPEAEGMAELCRENGPSRVVLLSCGSTGKPADDAAYLGAEEWYCQTAYPDAVQKLRELRSMQPENEKIAVVSYGAPDYPAEAADVRLILGSRIPEGTEGLTFCLTHRPAGIAAVIRACEKYVRTCRLNLIIPTVLIALAVLFSFAGTLGVCGVVLVKMLAIGASLVCLMLEMQNRNFGEENDDEDHPS